MARKIENLQPSELWKRFAEICEIPRCSKNEKAVTRYLIDLADKKGFKAKKDRAGNVVIEVPATPGYEDSPVVVLQSHVDMVCEKNSDKKHNFKKDPIIPVIDKGWVRADGTSLGADNGIGAAAELALLDDKSAVHGPLELLFTVDEETGLHGAAALSSDFLKGRILLNLDSEEEGKFVVGCAGGKSSEIILHVTRKTTKYQRKIKISLSGLRGGHSGMDINTGRGNAIQLCARLLLSIKRGYNLISFSGGSKHNAIPRECVAEICVDSSCADNVKSEIEQEFESIKFEYRATEKDMTLSLEEKANNSLPVDETSKKRFLSLVFGLPHGVYAMSGEMKDFVETSNNLAIVQLQKDTASMLLSTRSSVPSALNAINTKIKVLSDLAGADVKSLGEYPPWTPNLKSNLLKTMKKIYKQVTGKKAEVLAIHAGLECGLIGDKYPGMDMISFGPEIRNPHSPDERVNIESVNHFWNLLKATLKDLISF